MTYYKLASKIYYNWKRNQLTVCSAWWKLILLISSEIIHCLKEPIFKTELSSSSWRILNRRNNVLRWYCFLSSDSCFIILLCFRVIRPFSIFLINILSLNNWFELRNVFFRPCFLGVFVYHSFQRFDFGHLICQRGRHGGRGWQSFSL